MRRTFSVSLMGFCVISFLWGQSRWGDIRSLFRRDVGTHYSIPNYRSLDEWRIRRAHLRTQILTAAGLQPMLPKSALHARRFDSLDKGSFVVEKVLLETIPGYFLGGNLYLPKNMDGKKVPAVLVPHGHWKNGRIHDASDYSVPALCANLAAQGYAAFAYDMVGYNDTRQTSHTFGKSEQEQAWGFSSLGLQLWNSIRSLDFLQSLPMVDPSRIAVTGASGGATQSLLLAAVDDRLQASVPVCMVSATFQGDCTCEEAPGLRLGTNNMEIAALMAPKPMLLLSSKKDWTRRTPEEEYPAIQTIYRLYGQPDAVSSIQIDSGHNYNRKSREEAYRFLFNVLKPDIPYSAARENIQVKFRPQDLLVGALPANLHPLSQEEVFASWRELSRQGVKELTDPEASRLLSATVGATWPRRVDAIQAGQLILLERAGSGERVPARWSQGRTRETALLIDPSGSEAARRSRSASQFLSRGASMLTVDVYQTGIAQSPGVSCDRACLTFQRSDDANRVSDILTALSYLNSTRPSRITMSCSGKAGSWCVVAAAVTPSTVPLHVDLLDPEIAALNDQPSPLFIPGLERAGGMQQVLRLIRANHQLRIETAD
ncbi:dienelactone hydrolase family protein [uncultured Paludibaculum sp.]|uniref:alpha/beta hydrolase family protein n=1 Tax=uncultured Paludibaculum sp. TaxID=1765020 RepID=UPI002AAB792B|nr:acetylxylan esterase [uncultured Paludibaculum sp.]